MTLLILKIVAALTIILGSGWVARSNPRLGGFILALPLTSMIALAFNFAEFRDAKVSVDYARSTFFAVPLSLLFFVPFLLADRVRVGFWALFIAGIVLLGVGYGLHQVSYRLFERPQENPRS